jgi:hypothetical protein
MTYGKESAWYTEDFFGKGNPAAVVDFTYHPKAAWWFDHHSTTFKKPEWQPRFVSDPQHRLDPKYASCCRWTYVSLKRDFKWKAPKHFPEFATWGDIIDGAKYRSAKETIEMKHPALQMNAFIEALPHTAKEDKLMIELMSELPLAKVIRHPIIAKGIRYVRSQVKKSLVYQKKNIQDFGNVTFVDLSKDPLKGLMRYAPFYFYPKSVFGARMRRKGKLWYLGIGVNPWNKPKQNIDLGEVMRGYHGGGHKGVGAAEFHSRKEALRVFEEVKKLLRT